jgi:hypothetical protein
LHATLAKNLLTDYIVPKNNRAGSTQIAAFSSGGSQVDGCVGVTGGGAL